jgi:ribosomal protein S18 acetylase RimI-like enzyme
MSELREALTPGDPARIRALATATGFFSREEAAVAAELAEERLTRGVASGYHFLLAEEAGELLGFACFGPIPCTRGACDLYWIVIRPDRQGGGLGRLLLTAAEDRIAAVGGRRVYIDTSSRPQYAPTRAFYRACGFQQEALLADFYDQGDGKAIFCKVLDPANHR